MVRVIGEREAGRGGWQVIHVESSRGTRRIPVRVEDGVKR